MDRVTDSARVMHPLFHVERGGMGLDGSEPRN